MTRLAGSIQPTVSRFAGTRSPRELTIGRGGMWSSTTENHCSRISPSATGRHERWDLIAVDMGGSSSRRPGGVGIGYTIRRSADDLPESSDGVREREGRDRLRSSANLRLEHGSGRHDLVRHRMPAAARVEPRDRGHRLLSLAGTRRAHRFERSRPRARLPRSRRLRAAADALRSRLCHRSSALRAVGLQQRTRECLRRPLRGTRGLSPIRASRRRSFGTGGDRPLRRRSL